MNADAAMPKPPPATPGPRGDVLSEVLEAVRLTGAVFFLVDAAPPWVAEAPEAAALAPAILPGAQGVVSFHLVTEGTCWCRMPGEDPLPLAAGDVLLVPHGDPYALASPREAGAGTPLAEQVAWFRRMAAGELPFVVAEGGGGPGRIGIVCGFLGCDLVPFNPVLAALPRRLRLRRPAGEADGLAALTELAVRESREPHDGSRSVRLRLAELMFVEVVRRHLGGLGATDRGWLAGLRDPLVGRALTSLHHHPERRWSIAELARESGASRSVLVERFTRLVGEPPMRYLLRWRMQLAARLLAGGSAKVAAVARRVGYDSEAAFSRAFRKNVGSAPSRWRRRQREGAEEAAQEPPLSIRSRAAASRVAKPGRSQPV